jgi:arylsulfatase A-like enzyme
LPAANNRAAPLATDHEPPNIVIFLIDTLRADRLGVYDYQRRPTSPRIDALAAESVVFEQACAPAPWTLPTLVSLMTSTFPCEHRVLNERQKLSDSADTLAARLKRIGYTTLGLYANAYAGRKFGMHVGYDHLKSSPRNEREQVTDLLDRFPQTPFYLYIHNLEPHHPHHYAPAGLMGFRRVPLRVREKIDRHYKAYRTLTRIDFKKKQPLGTTDNTAKQDRHLAALTALRDDYNELYDAAVWVADMHVGSVIDLLKERGLWENTLFFVLSDHGEELNEHGGWLHDQSVYEELMHVPLIVRFPHGQHAGRRVKSVVSLVDVLPTLFDYLEQPELSRGARGRSLMPLIRDKRLDHVEDFTVPGLRINRKKYYRPWKESRGDVNVVVRRGHWKGIWNVEPDTFELYDLAQDPGEQNELGAAQPELVTAMRAFARSWYKQCGETGPRRAEDVGELDEETRQNLRALGYLD